MKSKYAFLLLLACLALPGMAQPPQPDAGRILHKMQQLKVLGSALYVAAHPDDENTRLIAWLANERQVKTAYLALTRGDGGQNLIGPELREGLGVIRTQELLAARRIDGGQQFFTRANDFGYSKNARETLRIWDSTAVLHDVVWVIRQFRPDVIITRFPPDARAGHGHHTTSAIMAQEAFQVAGTTAFADQLQFVKPWQPTRIMVNSGRWWDKNIAQRDDVIRVDVGTYNPLLGESYTEMAARSRSMHKSQGFGVPLSRGHTYEYLSLVAGQPADKNIFDGIDITWGRTGHPEIAGRIDKIIAAFDPRQPAASVPALVELYKAIEQVEDDFWRQRKLAETEELILACSGLFSAAWAADYTVVPGERLDFDMELVNRSVVPVKVLAAHIASADTTLALSLQQDNKYLIKWAVKVPPDQPFSNPYWLQKSGTLGMYRVDDLQMIGRPENPPAFTLNLDLEINGLHLTHHLPLVYRWTDRVNGEMHRPVAVTPPVFLNLSSPVYIFKNNEPRQVQVAVKAVSDKVAGKVHLQVPQGWQVSPAVVPLTLQGKGQSSELTFTVTPKGPSSGKIKAVMEIDRQAYSLAVQNIAYNHIPYQIIMPPAEARAENLDIKLAVQRVGYVMGAGDRVPEALRQMGLEVVMLDKADINAAKLATIDVLVFGIRAANTLPWLKEKKPDILAYMEQGGTVVMQYNTGRRLNWQDFAPYELRFTGRSADSRVADEKAPVTILQPGHPLMNYPNKISPADFRGWVQERGLYFPAGWDERYTAILSSHDPGEEPKDGGLLVADYGKGHFIYTGYSWFRELPAGVPGAYRIFANLLSYGRAARVEKTGKGRN